MSLVQEIHSTFLENYKFKWERCKLLRGQISRKWRAVPCENDHVTDSGLEQTRSRWWNTHACDCSPLVQRATLNTETTKGGRSNAFNNSPTFGSAANLICSHCLVPIQRCTEELKRSSQCQWPPEAVAVAIFRRRLKNSKPAAVNEWWTLNL